MNTVTFSFDTVSPYAYLAFEQLPQALEGLSVVVRYRPVLLAAMLAHGGQKGPAEIPPKRDWTYRQVGWLARQHGLDLRLPAEHPFNPLPLQRLALACAGPDGLPGRWVCEQLFRHVWHSEAHPTDPARLALLTQQLQPAQDPASDAVKQALRRHTDEAIAAGVFGVPSFEWDGRVFWGFDALPMLAAALRGDAFFAPGGGWDAAAAPRPGVQRR